MIPWADHGLKASQTKVQNLDVARLVDHYVGGLEVSVNNAFGMRRLERRSQLFS
ncbi:hypothetical protein HRbin09_02104 [bacterium HR09]|nr:hypothetical protein HRbin09_02104 [bacterium HR09]